LALRFQYTALKLESVVTLAREAVEMLSLEPVAARVLVAALVLLVVAPRVLELGLPAMLTTVIVPMWRHRLALIQDNRTDLLKSVLATADGSNRNVPCQLPLAVRFDHSEKDHS
jgi:hypothetical protein